MGGWFWMRVCLFNRLLRSSAFAASLWSTWLLSRRAFVRLVVSQWLRRAECKERIFLSRASPVRNQWTLVGW